MLALQKVKRIMINTSNSVWWLLCISGKMKWLERLVKYLPKILFHNTNVSRRTLLTACWTFLGQYTWGTLPPNYNNTGKLV